MIQIHPPQNGFLLHENNLNLNHTIAFNFSQQTANKMINSVPKIQPLPSLLWTSRWIPEAHHTYSCLSLCLRIFGLVQDFLCPHFSPGAVLWTGVLVMAGAAASHCYPEGVHQHRHIVHGHYLFTDSSRLIWKRVLENYDSSPWLTWYILSNVPPLKLLSAILDVAAVLLKLCYVPLGCANLTAMYLFHRWTCNDLKVFSAVFLLKKGMQSLEHLLDVILWKKSSNYWVLEGN